MSFLYNHSCRCTIYKHSPLSHFWKSWNLICLGTLLWPVLLFFCFAFFLIWFWWMSLPKTRVGTNSLCFVINLVSHVYILGFILFLPIGLLCWLMMPNLLTVEVETLTEYRNNSVGLACITYLNCTTHKKEDLKNVHTAVTFLEDDSVCPGWFPGCC